jgi:hypothetical protein
MRSVRRREHTEGLFAGATLIDVTRHPAGIRCTDLQSETGQRTPAVIRRAEGQQRSVRGSHDERARTERLGGQP